MIGRRLDGHWRFLFPVLAASLPLFFLNLERASGSALLQLYGFAHLVFFALLAYWLQGAANSTQRTYFQQAIFIAAVIIGVGGAIELIQPYFGRSASWRDLGIDILGGGLGIAYLATPYRKSHHPFWMGTRIIIIAVGVVVFYGPIQRLWDMGAASHRFPVLSDFETPLEAKRWTNGTIDEHFAIHGKCSLKVLLETKKYAGTTLRRSIGDWSGYTAFAFSLYNPDDQELPISVSIRDREHFKRGAKFHDRFNCTYRLKQGWNDVTIPIADIQNAPQERKLDLDDLSEVVIFTVDPPAPRQMYLDYVRLIR